MGKPVETRSIALLNNELRLTTLQHAVELHSRIVLENS